MDFINKKTNLKWEISDKEHIRRLLRDSDYELITDEAEEDKVNAKKSIKKVKE